MSNINSVSVMFSALLFTLSNLSAMEAYIHEEKAGVVSLEAEHFFDNNGWGEKFYYTGEAVKPDEKYLGDGENTTQFLLGDLILVVPVVEKGATIKMANFPEGKWYDFENGVQYEGGKMIPVSAPIDKISWFVREGSILPMRKYARSVELGSNDLLEIYLYSSSTKSSYTLLEDDGISNDYKEGKYTETTFELEKLAGLTMFNINATNGVFENMPTQRTFELILKTEKKPSRVLLNDIPIPGYKNKQIIQKPYWQYDADKKLVRITFDALCREDHKVNLMDR